MANNYFSNPNQIGGKSIPLSKTKYNGPQTTLTESLQEGGAFKEKLKGYESVSNIDSVNDNCHVRYFVYNVGEERWKFRMGGFLRRRHPKYIVLSNGRQSWSVQKEIQDSNSDDVYETKFFRLLGKNELSSMALDAQQEEIERLRSENAALRQYSGMAPIKQRPS